MRYSIDRPPPQTLWWSNYARGLAHGLTNATARAYATLTWWGEHHGITTPSISSGARTAVAQRAMRERWDRGDRRGLVARPAERSKHVEGKAFDLAASAADLQTLGRLAPYAGLRWGGTFQDYDPVHFDL